MEQIKLTEANGPSTVLWQPSSGAAMAHLRNLLVSKGDLPNAAAFDHVEHAASDIVARCLPPHAKEGRRTGLVVGYVQSGKTISMTSVASLARDNGFGLVICLAGTKDNLVDQSWNRFKKYLLVDDGPRRPWYMFTTAKGALAKSGSALRDSIEGWKGSARTITGTVSMPSSRAANQRPWPLMITPLASTTIG